MTEAVMEILQGPMIHIIGNGFGIGSFFAISANLLSYAISKALSLVDDK